MFIVKKDIGKFLQFKKSEIELSLTAHYCAVRDNINYPDRYFNCVLKKVSWFLSGCKSDIIRVEKNQEDSNLLFEIFQLNV